MINKPKYIVFHCSDVSQTVIRDQFNSINAYHRDERQFPVSSLGLYVGYQRLITGGKNYQCRLDTDMGAHCNQVQDGLSMNLQSLGICIGFAGDSEMPLKENLDLFIAQVEVWQKQYNIPNENVRFHREWNTEKTCPGSLITREWLTSVLWPPTAPISPNGLETCNDKDVIIQKQQENLTAYQTLVELLYKFISSLRK